jgi:hypothetical protein
MTPSRVVDWQHPNLLHRIAAVYSASLFFKKDRELWEKNSRELSAFLNGTNFGVMAISF